MERIPVTPGYRSKLTWRFRLGSLLLLALAVLRARCSTDLGIDLGLLPFEAVWNPPSRAEELGLVVLVELLNYVYAFLFLFWVCDGLVLSFDFLGLRLREARWRARRERKALASLEG